MALGETAVGLALLLGLLTGIAAFGGVFMNGNFVLAGALGSNPVLIVLGALLMVAWRNAGWIGLDRWLIPLTQGAGPTPATAEPTTQGRPSRADRDVDPAGCRVVVSDRQRTDSTPRTTRGHR